MDIFKAELTTEKVNCIMIPENMLSTITVIRNDEGLYVVAYAVENTSTGEATSDIRDVPLTIAACSVESAGIHFEKIRTSKVMFLDADFIVARI